MSGLVNFKKVIKDLKLFLDENNNSGEDFKKIPNLNKDHSKKVIMQILPSIESGGVERGVIDIAKALKKENFEPIVVSSGGVLLYDLRESNITHVTLPLDCKNPLTIFLNIKKIAELIEKYHVDIVHVRSRAPMWSAYYACKQTNTKLISTVHGSYSLGFFRWKVFPPKRIYNEIMLKANKVIAVSNYIKEYLIKNYFGDFADKITVIHRGADLKFFNLEMASKSRFVDLSKKWNLPEDKKIILMPARFTSWKGHEFLIDALAKVRGEFFCVMVGSDHGHKFFRKKIEQKIISENLAGKIRIAGLCKDMLAAYSISHFVVSPSIRPEAFGRIAIEAQASEKIIVSTKIGGALETIIDGKTGFLVEVGDVESLARTIDNILKMPKSEVDAMGREGRKHIEENFSNDKMCGETIELYRSMLNL